MKTASRGALFLWLLCGALSANPVYAQEARSGIDLRATLTAQAAASNELTQAPRSGSPVVPGSRSVVYPTLKINDSWFISAALQLVTRPYYFSDFSTTGYGVKGSVLQSALNYSHIWDNGSILVRAGEMPTAFGSFPLRYDDAVNPLVDLPPGYGYYYSPISILGVAGAQIDATRSKWDGRIQFANSSPANPRSIFARDQYGNWAGGGGFTIRQGFRVGISAYHGPFLSRDYQFFFPGEANPSTLPAHAIGIDANWAHNHTSAQGEWQRFVMPYEKIPTFHESVGYGEVKQILNPRWYLAFRGGWTSTSATGKTENFETAAGYRPNRLQLLKIGYEYEHYSAGSERDNNVVAVQFVTSLHWSVSHE